MPEQNDTTNNTQVHNTVPREKHQPRTAHTNGEKTCAICGTAFNSPFRSARFCSRSCGSKGRTQRTKGRYGVGLPDELIRKGIDLVNGGMTWELAAVSVGMSGFTLRKRAKTLGLPRRRGHLPLYKTPNLKLPDKQTDLAYLAAFIDGEGSIAIRKHPRNVVIVSCSNTYEPVMRWIESLGGCLCHVPPRGKRNACWQWGLSGREDVKLLLESILPYMRVKHDRAILALEAIVEFNTRPII